MSVTVRCPFCPAGQAGQLPTLASCEAAGQLPPKDCARAPARDRPGVRQRGHRWYRTHLGPETAREHSFRASPRRGHAQHRGTWGSPRLWLPARCSRPPHSSWPRRATYQAGQEGRPSPGGGKELRSFCTHRNRADSLNHSLSRS